MSSVRVMNWMNDAVRQHVANQGVPAYAAMWALEIANEIQPVDLRLDQPGCGHLILHFKLVGGTQIDIITDLSQPETFTPEAAQIHIRTMRDALNPQSQLRAAAAAKPERGAKPN
jgi:hypothetical protein